MLKLALVCETGELTGVLCHSINVPAVRLFVNPVVMPFVFVPVPSALKVAPDTLLQLAPATVHPPRSWKV